LREIGCRPRFGLRRQAGGIGRRHRLRADNGEPESGKHRPVARARTGLNAANDSFNLAASLSLAGHEVFIAKDVDELRTRRDATAPDLILVDASRAGQIEIQPVSDRAGTVILLAMSKELDLALLELESTMPLHVVPTYSGRSSPRKYHLESGSLQLE
jgi:hypothetical protein